jgi:TatD DNase family protein
MVFYVYRFTLPYRLSFKTRKPLIIHTRSAAEDTLRIMRKENAADIGGVMHYFTETLDVA